MSISLDAVASRHLWHMQDIGRLWEQHSNQSGSPVSASILVDVLESSARERSDLHVFPTAQVSDESFLSRALEASTSDARRDGTSGSLLDTNRPARILSPGVDSLDIVPSPAPPGMLAGSSGVNGHQALLRRPPLERVVARTDTQKDEFGLRRFLAEWKQDRKITFHNVEHLCPPIPTLDDDNVPSGRERRRVRIDGSVVEGFLGVVALPTLTSVTWEVLNGVISCARHFIDKRSFQKPWYLIGPAELKDIEYACILAGGDECSLSMASMSSKSGGVTGLERALTIVVLFALSPF